MLKRLFLLILCLTLSCPSFADCWTSIKFYNLSSTKNSFKVEPAPGYRPDSFSLDPNYLTFISYDGTKIHEDTILTAYSFDKIVGQVKLGKDCSSWTILTNDPIEAGGKIFKTILIQQEGQKFAAELSVKDKPKP